MESAPDNSIRGAAEPPHAVPLSRLTLGLVLCFAAGLFAFLGYCEKAGSQPVVPIGCDEFGYLQMAEAFAQGRALDDHTPRPFARELFAELDRAGFAENEYMWMVAPHAYHFDARAGQVINQYPPATSYLLSWLPIASRYALFPALVGLLFFFPLAFVMLRFGGDSPLGFRLASVFLLFLVCLYAPPLSEGFGKINSTGPTYGLMIALGFVVRRRPDIALLLLGCSILFRFANCALVIPLMAWHVFGTHRRNGGASGGYLVLARRGVAGALWFGAGGFFLYQVYIWAVMGAPMRLTYGRSDVKMATFERVLDNWEFYFHERAGWMWVNLIVTAVLWILCVGDRKWLRWAAMASAVLVWNYLFFLTHKVHIDYYPYGSALILLGVCLEVCNSHAAFGLFRRKVAYLGAAALIFMLPTVHVPTLFAEEDYIEQKKMHEDALSEFDVVWAGIRSGTAEYFAETAGFRFEWCKPEARAHALRFLATQGYRQAVWVDEPTLDKEKFESDLQAAGVAANRVWTPVGFLYVVEGVL